MIIKIVCRVWSELLIIIRHIIDHFIRKKSLNLFLRIDFLALLLHNHRHSITIKEA